MTSLLPPNSTKLERALESVTAMDLPVQIADLWNPATCPEPLLPWLAWALHITDAEGWSLATTTSQRRALLARSVALHKKKGTPWSIRQALIAAGFNDLEIVERLPANRYDGSLIHAGAERYDAYGWAQFRVTADVGDDQPISSENTARITETINEFKPARCQLVDVQYRASVAESVASGESSATAGALSIDDAHQWGRRSYDGSLHYNQGLLHRYEGAFAFSGARDYSGFSPSGERFDSEQESDGMAGSLALSDRQSRVSLFDGNADYGGSADFGASAPVAEDLPMPITLRRHRRYDGRRAYAAHCYNGSARYVGELTHFGNIPYTGDVVTTLEA